MKELVLDAADWATPNDLYDSFFAAVGAPSWHGRNFNALRDSVATGSINAVEVPYRIVIVNADLVGAGARQITSDFISLMRELANSDCPVEISTASQDAAEPGE